MKNLHNEEIFKDSITSYIPKYITVNNDTERLPYQKSELIRAKSAMFFPLYIDNVYIGYWIIESSVPHAFDKIDTMILEVVRDNIVAVLKTVSYQNIIETIVRKDEFTKLPSAEYLYGAAKRIIDQHTISALCMFRISNIEEINEEYGRKTGNETIIQVANKIRDSIAKDYIFVRYMGPKFVIVFSGVKKDDVVEYIEDLKKDTEELEIEEVIDDDENQEVRYIKPTLNFVISTYYKGTGMESVLKKMEEFLDNAEKSESDISYI